MRGEYGQRAAIALGVGVTCTCIKVCCGFAVRQGIAAPARYDHIYLIVFENLSYASYLSYNSALHSLTVAAKCAGWLSIILL